MVRAVWGKCENFDVVFKRRGDTNLWDVDVPFERDGNYVVSLYAIDCAGNQSYYATVLFTVKRFCITVHILDINADAKIGLNLKQMDGVTFRFGSNDDGYKIVVKHKQLFLHNYIQLFIKAEKCLPCNYNIIIDFSKLLRIKLNHHQKILNCYVEDYNLSPTIKPFSFKNYELLYTLQPIKCERCGGV